MKVAFCADVVGRPGRTILKKNLKTLREKFDVDLIVVNTENASHGFGLTIKNYKELKNAGIDMMTGGNHTWDKNEIISLMDEEPILRPANYPKASPGRGVGYLEHNGEKLAVINLMGWHTMPMVDNPFSIIEEIVEKIKNDGIKNIFIDMHAEFTAEKRVLFGMLKGKVGAICGSHTHVGTDDLTLDDGTFYVTDVGLVGCRDNSLGMEFRPMIDRCTRGYGSKGKVPTKCKSIFQSVVFELEDGKCLDAFKVKAYDDGELTISQRAYFE